MRIPATPEEAKELEKKLAVNDKVGDWVAPMFPTVGISIPSGDLVDNLMQEIGDTRLPPKPKQ